MAAGRWRWPILAGFLLWRSGAAGLCTSSGDWPYSFTVGQKLLFGHLLHIRPGQVGPHGGGLGLGPGGLRVYAAHPSTQIGPPALVLGGVLALAGWSASLALGKILMLAAGLAIVGVLESTARQLRPVRNPAGQRPATLLGGIVILWTWPMVATYYLHPDDALVLLATALAVRELARGHHTRLALYAGLAAAAKPWGVVCLPLALCAPRPMRMRTLILACGVPVACWLPFLLADPGTLAVASFKDNVTGFSALRLFGVAMGPMPGWTRPAQLLGGSLLATATAIRGRWLAIPVVGIAWRLLLEPNDVAYYATGLLVAAVIYDQSRDGDGWPVLGLGCLFLLVPFEDLPVPPLLVAGTKLLACLLCMLAAALGGQRPPGTDRTRRCAHSDHRPVPSPRPPRTWAERANASGAAQPG